MRLVSDRHGSRRQLPPRRRASALNATALLLLLLLPAAAETSSAGAFLRRAVGAAADAQCLSLDEGVAAEEACQRAPHVRLRFCDAHALDHLLPLDGRPCDEPLLSRLRRADERARLVARGFARLLRRFDCDIENSVSWTCSDCKAAYKQWVCAMFLPPVHVVGDVGPLKPCRYVCRLVEQRCPYFHPSVREQYAGERVFKCIDPDIPDLDSMESASVYGLAGRCYCPHHLDREQGEGDPECRILTPAQWRDRVSAAGSSPSPSLLLLWTLLLLLAAAR